ncbi:MAG: lipid-A-disaccharide synthase [Chitinophagales bacterium]|nr:lipid-A-disaccharide synthase [Chitinophagales bacterium]
MKYYIIAGEASGDLHGSNLIRSLRSKDPNAEIRFWGGDKMKEAGGDLVEHYKNIAFMGFAEVVKHLPLILRKIKFCKKDIQQYKPDAVILIDYPGFNLRIAEFVAELDCKLIYYISPQIWAWKESRIHKIKKTIDKMIVILPFEKEFYAKWGMDVDYVGHPLSDVIHKHHFKSKHSFIGDHQLEEKPIIALLPGSRKQEISKMLKHMLSIEDNFKDYQLVIAGLKEIPQEYYKGTSKRNVSVIYDDTYNLLRSSEAALVTSGTATLETALIGTPQIVCYKGSFLSYWIGRMLVKVKYIAMPNLILDKNFIPELIQSDLNKMNLKKELESILYTNKRNEILDAYSEINRALGETSASEKTGSIIVDLLTSEKT